MTLARLSALDAAFLALESPQAPMHVGWAALFSPPSDGPRPSLEAIRAHVEGRLHRAPRYRQKVVEVPMGVSDPVWVDHEGFDIRQHVRRADGRDFGRLVDEVMSTPLDHDRPLWELWIAEELEDGHLGLTRAQAAKRINRVHESATDLQPADTALTGELDTRVVGS